MVQVTENYKMHCLLRVFGYFEDLLLLTKNMPVTSELAASAVTRDREP